MDENLYQDLYEYCTGLLSCKGEISQVRVQPHPFAVSLLYGDAFMLLCKPYKFLFLEPIKLT
jgi:hypothetical protein